MGKLLLMGIIAIVLGLSGYSQKKEVGKVILVEPSREVKGLYNICFEMPDTMLMVVTGCPARFKDTHVNSKFLLEFARKDTIYIRPLAIKPE